MSDVIIETQWIIRARAQRASLISRRGQAWGAVQMFLANGDVHGVMDLCVEIQALDRAIKEIEAVSV